MTFPYLHKSKSESDSILIANEFAASLRNGMIIILNGDLGVGKTFFIKHVFRKS